MPQDYNATLNLPKTDFPAKEYVATIRLGATTPSYDLEHEIDATYPTEHITRGLVDVYKRQHLERALTCVDHYASGELFHLCRCRDCGFLFTQDFPVEAEIGRYYETPDYISHTCLLYTSIAEILPSLATDGQVKMEI